MKRIYIKPITEIVYYNADNQLLANSTIWQVQEGESDMDPDKVDDDLEPNPNSGAGAKGVWNMEDLWEY